MVPDCHSITILLRAWGNGDREALDQLEPLVHDVLYLTARRLLADEWGHRTLQPTELVHEAWVNLLGSNRMELSCRTHFYNLFGRIMKRLLINRAVARRAAKKKDWQGQGVNLVYSEDLDMLCGSNPTRLLELEQAMERLGERDPRKERLVTYYCFCGFTCPQIARVEGVSPATVKRELKFSFSWLRAFLEGETLHEQ